MRKLLFNLHLYLALVTGAFVLILGVTGSVMAFESELSDLFHARLVYVTPGTKRLSLAEIGTVVSNSFPGERIRGYYIATAANRSYGVHLNHRTVHVNPYNGTVLGVHLHPDKADIFLDRIHQLHLRLLVNNKADSGKEIVRWSCVVVIFLLASGVYLWWLRKRITIQWDKRDRWSSRNFWYDIHNAVGIFSVVLVLMLAITGVAIGFERQTTALISRITHSEPAFPRDAHLTPADDARPISPDQAIAIARGALPGAAPFDISLPGSNEVYDVRCRFPEDRTPAGRSRVLIDQYSGKVTFALGSRTAPAPQRLVNLNRAIHTGDLFGMPSKLAVSLASLAMALQMASGTLMWWKRLKKEE